MYPSQLPGELSQIPAEIYHCWRQSTAKMWYLAKLIWGMSFDQALAQLEFSDQKTGARIMKEVLLKAQDIAVGDHNSDPTCIWLSPLQGKANTWYTSISPWGWLWDHGIILWSWWMAPHLHMRHQRQCNPYQRRYSGVSKPNHHIHTVWWGNSESTVYTLLLVF